MNGRHIRRGLALAAVAPGLLLASCSRSPGDLIAMEIDEWSVALDISTTQSGPVRFDISHTGELIHDLVLMPGNSPDDMPRNDDGSLDITTRRPIDEIREITPGTYRVNAPNLPQGDYIWVCSIQAAGPDGKVVNHMDQGMWTQLEVTRRPGIVDDQT